jgi:hypothetical protein
MRQSKDELNQDGTIKNGFDYNLQVWIRDGICTDVGSGAKYAGKPIKSIPGHEIRKVVKHD